MELRRRSLRGYTRRHWDLRHLSRAELQGSRSRKGSTWRAVLVIDGGMDAGRHPVTRVYTNGRGHARAVAAINRWLDSAPPPA